MDHPFELFQRWFPGEVIHDTGFYQAVAATLPPTGKILDLGCGDNNLLASYRTAQREVWGTDFAAHPELKHSAWFRPLDAGGAIPFADGTFDHVASFMVMEHVVNSVRYFNEISRVLKPGGHFVGQSIHALHYVTWIRRLFDLVPHGWVQRLVKSLYGREEHDTFPTCYRLNTRRAVARAAHAANLDCVSWRGYASQGYFLFSPMAFRISMLTDWGLEKLHKGLGKIYFTVVLQKPALLKSQYAPLALAA